jgi:predicted dehydrogenase
MILTGGDDGSPTELAVPAGNYLNYYTALGDAVRGRGDPPVTPAQASTLMAVIEAGIQSWAEGEVVSPQYTDAESRAWRAAAE